MSTQKSTKGSRFLHGLAEKFHALQATHGMLRADWDHIVGSGQSGEWRLTGAASTIEFEILAKHAASALPDAGSSDVIAWLEVLRLKSGRFKLENGGIEQNADGTDGAEHLRGTIPHLCAVSAEYCHQLESKAMDAEFRERQNAPQPEVTEMAEPLQVSAESVGHQINRYREECRMTVEKLAEKMKLNTRSVQRHIADTVPLARNITAYERVFSKSLNREIVIKNMP
jgi:hypothetical protein